jgi:hypothetical protein
MKSLFKVLGIIAIAAVMVTVSGCVTATSIGGTSGPHGFFTGGSAGSAIMEGGTLVAEYSVILGLFDSGYAHFAEKVKAAEAEGKVVTSKQTWYFGILTKVSAYAK